VSELIKACQSLSFPPFQEAILIKGECNKVWKRNKQGDVPDDVLLGFMRGCEADAVAIV
jgi:hypothetical protein